MSNAINQATWEIINSTSYEIEENAKAQKRGQARIAEANHSQGRQQVAKDLILPSAGDGQTETIAKGKGDVKPNLPVPKKTFAGLTEDDGDDDGSLENGKTLGLIAIIGEVMALQAKTNSNFWSTLWKQASESMMMEVKFAPIIGSAIKSAYTAQSQATMAQANMAKEDGMINLFMFGGSMLFGVISEANDAAGAGEDANLEDETKNTENDAPTSPNSQEDEGIEQELDSEGRATNTEEQQVNRESNREESTWKNRLKRTSKFIKDVGSRSYQRLGGALGKGMQYAMGAQMLSQGITGWFVDSKYKAQQADKEQEEGQAQALSKEAEQYSQFYGQAFSRSDTLTQGVQQNIDYAMNILKSAADTITSTVTSMFRG
jgi:hypothetical protein